MEGPFLNSSLGEMKDIAGLKKYPFILLKKKKRLKALKVLESHKLDLLCLLLNKQDALQWKGYTLESEWFKPKLCLLHGCLWENYSLFLVSLSIKWG